MREHRNRFVIRRREDGGTDITHNDEDIGRLVSDIAVSFDRDMTYVTVTYLDCHVDADR